MAIFIDGRVVKSGNTAGFLNIQDPRNLAKLVKQALAESPEYSTQGGDLIMDLIYNTENYDFTITGNGDVVIRSIDPTDSTINNTVSVLPTGSEMTSEDSTNTLNSSVRTVPTGAASVEATDGTITSVVAVTNTYAQLGTSDGTITSNVLAEVSSGVAMTYDDGSNVAAIAVVADAGDGLPGVKSTGLAVYADEAAAVIGSLQSGVFYQTATGEVRVKL